MKQVQDAYIVAATRTPIGRSHKGSFKHLRPDDLLAHALRSAMAQVPGLDPASVEDVIAGCAIPEAQQGLNVARIGAILAGLPNSVGGITSTASAPRACRPWPWRPTASAWARPM